MIRIWLWEEAPVELRDYPTLTDPLRGKVPVWLAHLPAGQSDEITVLGEMASVWRMDRRGRWIHMALMNGDAGILLAGCLADSPRTEEQKT